MGRKKKTLKYEYIQDIKSSIEHVYPSFKNESGSRQLSLIKAISCIREIHDRKLFIMTNTSLRNVGTSLDTVNNLLEDYPLLVWNGEPYKKNTGWDNGVPKYYHPTKELCQVLKHHAMLTESKMMVYYQENGEKAVMTAYEKLPSHIIKTDYDYKVVSRINVEELEGFILTMQFDKHVDYHETLAMRLLASAKSKDGVLDQYYFRGETGRLFSGGLDSLQNIPKILRKRLFTGAYDVDFINCHYVIASHFTENEYINDYAADCEKYRNEIARECDITYKEAKTGLLMLMYGAGKQVHKGKSLVEMMGKDRTRRFLDNEFVSGVLDGIKGMRDSYGYNPSEFSGFMQKHEAMILDVCISEYPAELLLFDGFITYADVDTDHLEQCVFDELKMEIKIGKELIQ